MNSTTGELQPLGPVTGHQACWSPDGSTLCYAADDHINLWNVSTWEFERGVGLVPPSTTGAEETHDVAWHGHNIVVLQADGWGTLIDTRTWNASQVRLGGVLPTTMRVSDDGSRVAVSYMRSVDIRTFPSCDLITTLSHGGTEGRRLFWSLDDAVLHLVTDVGIEYWYTNNWTRTTVNRPSADAAFDEASSSYYLFSPLGGCDRVHWPNLTYVRDYMDTGLRELHQAVLSHDGSRVFALGDGYRMVHVPGGGAYFSGPRSPVPSWAWAADFSLDHVAFGSRNDLEVWDTGSGQRYHVLRESTGGHENLDEVAFSADGAYLAYSRTGGRLRIWNVPTKGQEVALSSATDFHHLAWHPARNVLVYLDGSEVVRFYDVDNRTALPSVLLDGERASVARWSPDGSLLCYALMGSGEAVFVDFETREVVHTLTGRPVDRPVAFSPDGGLFVFRTDSRNLTVLDTSTWEEVASLGTLGNPRYLDWGPYNRSIVVGSAGGIELWWVANWSRVALIDYLYGPVEFGASELEVMSVGQDVVRFRAPYAILEPDIPDTTDEDTPTRLSVEVVATNHVLTLRWDMDDGNETVGRTVEHTWETPGWYNVTVTAWHGRGFANRHVQEVFVADRTPPVARITGPLVVDEDAPFRLSGLASSDNWGIARFFWTFEGGTVYHDAEAVHTYAEPGRYTVMLTVHDRGGFFNDTSVSVLVRDVTPPTAVLDAPAAVDEDTIVVLSAAGSSDNVGVTDHRWTLSDGRTPSGESVTVIFDIPGEYTIELNVSDAAGNHILLSHRISVRDVTAPVIVLSAPGAVDEDVAVELDASGSWDEGGGNLTFVWELPDGGNLDGPNVTVVFPDPGDLAVGLTVTDGSNNTNVTAVHLVVRDVTPPVIVLDSTTRTVEEDVAVPFDASDSRDNAGIAGWSWMLGPDRVSTGNVTSITFPDPGTYVVNLTVTDTSGLASSVEIVVTVVDVTPPVLAVEPNGTVRVQAGASGRARVVLDASGSHDNVAVTAYEWDLGGDGTVEGTGPTFEARLGAGEHVVRVRVRDGAGLEGSEVVTVVVMEAGEGGGAWHWILLGLVVVAVLGVTLGVALQARRRA